MKNFMVFISSIVFSILIFEYFLRIVDWDIGSHFKQKMQWDHFDVADPKARRDLKATYNRIYSIDDDIGHIPIYLTNASQISKKRMLFLGDSILGDRDTVSILQSELVRENRSFSRDDILCAAAAGWNTTNQWRYIKKFGKQIEPEAVYIFFNLNDFSTTPVIIKSQEGDWNAFQFGEFNQVISNLSLLEFKLGQLLVWSATFGINYQEIKNFPSNQGYIESLNSLLNIKKWTSENEVSLKVFITPVFGPFEKYDKFGRAYDRAMQLKEKLKNQIDIIDIVPEFFTEENNSRQYALTHSDIGHPNSKGKQALIKKVLEKL